MNYKKGQETKKSILDKTRLLFNQKGIALTIEVIAREIGLTRSRISNHFPTRESLLQAIMEGYEQHLATVVTNFPWRTQYPDFQLYAEFLNEVMDVQYEFRAGIAYAAVVTPYQQEALEHIHKAYRRNLESIKNRVNQLMQGGLLTKEILEPANFDVFVYQYTTLLTTWVISLQLYEQGRIYPEVKPKYIRGALNCFKPFMTEAGRKNFESIDFEQFKTVKWNIGVIPDNLHDPGGML